MRVNIRETNKGYLITINKKIVARELGFEDLMYIVADKSRAKARKKFDAICEYKEWNRDDIIPLLKEEMDKCIEEVKDDEIEEEFKYDESIDSWDKLKEIIRTNVVKREHTFKIVLATIASQWYADQGAVFLNLIAPRSKGKSSVLKCFPTNEFTMELLDCTLQAFAPGTADEEQTAHSILDECEDKTLIIHDASALLSGKDTKVDKVFEMFKASWGAGAHRKFSPGAGNRSYGGNYNMIMGITPRIYRKNIENFNTSGRFLYHKLPPINESEIILSGRTHPNFDRVKEACMGFLHNLHEKVKPIEINQSFRESANNFLQIYRKYQLIWRNSDGELVYHSDWEPEGILRRYNQMEMLAKGKALVEGKESIDSGDFEELKSLVMGADSLKEVHSKIKVLEDVVDLTKDELVKIIV